MTLNIRHFLISFVAITLIGAMATADISAAKPKQTKKQKTQQTQQPAPKRNRTNRQQAPKSSAEAKRLQNAAQKEIAQTKEQLRLNEQEVKKSLSDLNRLQSEISAAREKTTGLQKKVTSLSQEIDTLGVRIAANEAELQRMREEYLKAVRKMRLTRRNRSALAFIFASDDFNQALRRMRYMKQFSDWKEKQTADINAKNKLLISERERLAQAKEQQTAVLGQLTAAQRDLEGKHRKQEGLVAELRRNGSALQTHLSAKQQEANRLRDNIASLIAQEQAKAEAARKAKEEEAARRAAEKAAADAKAAAEKAKAEAAAAKTAAEAKEAEKKQSELKKEEERRRETERKEAEKREKKEREEKKKREKEERKKNSEKGSRKKSDRKKTEKPAPAAEPKETVKESASPSPNRNFASLRGSLPRPVDGSWRITNAFGRHSMPELPEVVYDNPGIDAEVAQGAPVKAVCDGKVSGVYKVAGYGNVVIVNHGEYYTVYGNLSAVNVGVGNAVNAGRILGKAGADPDDSARGSVHFEVWKGREKQNPAAWLK